MKLLIASDHAGFPMKEAFLKNASRFKAADGSAITFEDLGTKSLDSVDYPDYANVLADKLLKEDPATGTPSSQHASTPRALGVLICGSGVGISIAANRFKHIRAVLAESPEVAKLSREHNHANVLCLGGKIVSEEKAFQILTAFLNATPDLGERHARRIQKLAQKGC